MPLLCFLLAHQKKFFASTNTLKPFISTFGVLKCIIYFVKDVLSSSFSYNKTNNLLTLLNVGLIK